ncbi:MAG: phage tail protein [Bacillota bacterium]
MLSLGMFQFEIGTLAYQQLTRDRTWRHGRTDRFGARQASQYLGPGDDKVTLTGALIPGLSGSFSSLDTLAQMADDGDAYSLVAGTGQVFGAYVIERLGDTRENFLVDGLARKGDFTLELTRVPEQEAASANLLSSVLGTPAIATTLGGMPIEALVPTAVQLAAGAPPGADLVRSLAAAVQGALPIAEQLLHAFPLEVPVAELASRLGLPTSTTALTGTVDKLVAGGIVERTANGVRIVKGLMLNG